MNFVVHSEHRGLVHQIVTKISVSSGIWMAQLLMHSQKLAESNAPVVPLRVVAILGRYPKRARSGFFSMKYVFNTGHISTTHFSR